MRGGRRCGARARSAQPLILLTRPLSRTHPVGAAGEPREGGVVLRRGAAGEAGPCDTGGGWWRLAGCESRASNLDPRCPTSRSPAAPGALGPRAPPRAFRRPERRALAGTSGRVGTRAGARQHTCAVAGPAAARPTTSRFRARTTRRVRGSTATSANASMRRLGGICRQERSKA